MGMTKKFADVVVSGGGVAGLAAAVAFGSSGFDVLCVDPSPMGTNQKDPNADLRTTAYLQPAKKFLEQIGIWQLVQGESAALNVMRITDASGNEPQSYDFCASDISDEPFGWNVGNWIMRQALLDRISNLPNVTFLSGVSTNRILRRTSSALVGFSDGSSVEARLLIAADGRNSFVREAAGIEVARTDFGQMAITFAVTHPLPHNNVSTEVHRTGGPFTLVPLPDHQGKPCSAVVWMESNANVETLMGLDVEEFNAAATERSANILGPLENVSRRMPWPIISQLANRFYAERTALIAEAAHVVPPIGAQGLNMSLMDVQTLMELALQNQNGLGSPDQLKAYQSKRFNDVKLRHAGVGILNKTSMISIPAVQRLRAAGLQNLHAISPLRKAAMRLGLGAS